jgi:SAM-dependent methyltransferase
MNDSSQERNLDPVSRRYVDGDYAASNPDWDLGDSPWKAERIRELLVHNNIAPSSIVEVGCGAGGVLAALRQHYPHADMAGYDIASGAAQLWQRHAASEIRFELGDFLSLNQRSVDLILVLDVLEHLGDPFSFLDRLRKHGRHVVLHIPLDLSAVSVFRESPLLFVRKKVGHLHYFTRNIALAMLDECGYEVIESRYTGAALNAPSRSFKTRIAGVVRRAMNLVNRDLCARLLGGETLIVLARPRSDE